MLINKLLIVIKHIFENIGLVNKLIIIHFYVIISLDYLHK